MLQKLWSEGERVGLKTGKRRIRRVKHVDGFTVLQFTGSASKIVGEINHILNLITPVINRWH